MNPDEQKRENIPKGFESLLNQNQIVEAQESAGKKIESIEERIRKSAGERNSSSIRNIRTLKGDVEESVALGKTTVVGMAAAEERERATRKSVDTVVSIVRSEKTKKTLIYVSGFLLIIAGLIGLYYVYATAQNRGVVKIARIEPIVSVEKTTVIDTTNLTSEILRGALIDERSGANLQIGSILGVYLTKKITGDSGRVEEILLTTEEFFRMGNLGAPSRLVRSLYPEFLFGIHIFDGNQPFMVFKTNSYEAAFAGMLEWENGMEKNIGTLLRPPTDFAHVGTTSSIFDSRKFEDAVFKNMDARVLKNETGKILIAYSFPTRDILIISTNQETLGEIFSRLTSRKTVR